MCWKAGLRPRPVRVRHIVDALVHAIGGGHVGPVPQPGIGGVAVVARVVDIVGGLARLRHHGRFHVLGEHHVPELVGGVGAVEMQHHGVLVHHIDAGRARPGMGGDEAALRIVLQLPGEGDVTGGEFRAVAPGEIGLQLDGDREPVPLAPDQPVLEIRNVGAEQADHAPVMPEGGDRVQPERRRIGQHVLPGEHRVHAGGELREPDRELIPCRLRRRRRRAPPRQEPIQPSSASRKLPLQSGGNEAGSGVRGQGEMMRARRGQSLRRLTIRASVASSSVVSRPISPIDVAQRASVKHCLYAASRAGSSANATALRT